MSLVHFFDDGETKILYIFYYYRCSLTVTQNDCISIPLFYNIDKPGNKLHL